MAAVDESVLTKMKRRFMIIRYGGEWKGCVYERGDEELLLIPSEGISRAKLVEEIHDIMEADRTTTEYLLFCLMEVDGGRKVKLRIKNDEDLRYVLAVIEEACLYVILKSKQATASKSATNSFYSNQSTPFTPTFHFG